MASEAERVLEERARLAGLSISPDLSEKLLAYYDVLSRWNRKINLTSFDSLDRAVDRLLIEPVAAAAHLPLRANLADLGSGGGSPALPLALALGSPHLLMVESRTRKAAFLREAARVVEIDADVEAVRFEDLPTTNPSLSKSADVVSLRAVRQDEQTLRLAQWLAKSGGQIAMFLSRVEPGALPEDSSTWNITPSAMLVTFHVEHP